jgi:hypothetical protein
LPDGKPNLSVATPRTSDGKPNLTGLWHIDGSGHVNGFAWNAAQDLAPTTSGLERDLFFESGF